MATTAAALSLASPLAVQAAAAQAPLGSPTNPPTPATSNPPPVAPKPTAHRVDVRATITHVAPQGSAVVGTGTFKGAPFTSGLLGTRVRVISSRPLRVGIQITITARAGPVILNATATGTTSSLNGRANVAGGTGAYKGISGSGLNLSVANGRVPTARLRGSVKFVDRAKK